MIEYIYANNYKSFVNFKMEFDRINLLIGKNGTGKSNVFFLIASIRDLIRGAKNVLTENFSDITLTKWMKSNTQAFEIGFSDSEYNYVYHLEIEHDLNKKSIEINAEKVTYNGKTLFQMDKTRALLYDDDMNGISVIVDPTTSGISFVPQDGKHELLRLFREQVDRILICTPNPKNMIYMVQNDVFFPEMDFKNIASVFAGLMQFEPDACNDIISAFKEIEPSFIKAKIAFRSYFKCLSFTYKHKDVECDYYLEELSDGERMLFALYILLHGYMKRGYTLLLDEPDNYVSLREIQPWCIEMENTISDDGQCLLISHHPEVIDYLADINGIWLSRMESGESVIIHDPMPADNKELLTYSQMISRGMLDEAE